ncbi:MAG: helix-turn-helix domain-containing protein [Maricaulaceae bacterium]
MMQSVDKDRGVISTDGTKKARIERAALTLFAQEGIDQVTTKAIAAAAQVSEGLIYRHFSNKEGLARALMVAVHNRLTDIIREALALEDIRGQIRHIATAYCELADADWMLFRYHILYLHRFPNISADSNTDSNAGSKSGQCHDPLSLTQKLLEAAMVRGDIPTEDAHILAPMALGIVLQTAEAKVLGFLTAPLGDHLDLFVRRIEAVLDV